MDLKIVFFTLFLKPEQRIFVNIRPTVLPARHWPERNTWCKPVPETDIRYTRAGPCFRLGPGPCRPLKLGLGAEGRSVYLFSLTTPVTTPLLMLGPRAYRFCDVKAHSINPPTIQMLPRSSLSSLKVERMKRLQFGGFVDCGAHC